MKLLIAEDYPSLQMSYEISMAFWGFDFDIVSNGQEAVDYALSENGNYDLCLMDIDMPVMDGYEALKAIRRSTRYFPIIAVSGNSKIAHTFEEAGFDDYLEKPIEPDDLLNKINRLTVCVYSILFESEQVLLGKQKPTDQEHTKMLIVLAEEDLCEMHISNGNGNDLKMIVHKTIPFKIIQDLSKDDGAISIFLDRSKGNPAECRLYKHEGVMQTRLLTPEEYLVKCAEEDAVLEMFSRCEKVI